MKIILNIYAYFVLFNEIFQHLEAFRRSEHMAYMCFNKLQIIRSNKQYYTGLVLYDSVLNRGNRANTIKNNNNETNKI